MFCLQLMRNTPNYKSSRKTSSTSQGCAVSFDDFKKALGISGERYSDEDIEQLRVSFDRMADIFFDTWLKRLKPSSQRQSEAYNDDIYACE